MGGVSAGGAETKRHRERHLLGWLPENISTYGAEMDSLLALILYRRRPEALARLKAAWND